MFAHKETWGYSLWVGRAQVGAGVGLDLTFRLGRALTIRETRQWRKRGVLRLS